MRVEEIMPILEGAFQVGFMEAIKSYEPTHDMVRNSDVKKWLKMMRIDMRKFEALVKNGCVKPFRLGTGRNSPLYYSKEEIRKAVVASDMAAILTSREL